MTTVTYTSYFSKAYVVSELSDANFSDNWEINIDRANLFINAVFRGVIFYENGLRQQNLFLFLLSIYI